MCSMPVQNLFTCLFENMCFCVVELSFSPPPQQSGSVIFRASRTCSGSFSCNWRAGEFSRSKLVGRFRDEMGGKTNQQI
jgi:hypothetical protein